MSYRRANFLASSVTHGEWILLAAGSLAVRASRATRSTTPVRFRNSLQPLQRRAVSQSEWEMALRVCELYRRGRLVETSSRFCERKLTYMVRRFRTGVGTNLRWRVVDGMVIFEISRRRGRRSARDDIGNFLDNRIEVNTCIELQNYSRTNV